MTRDGFEKWQQENGEQVTTLTAEGDEAPTYSPNCISCRMTRPGDPTTHADHLARVCTAPEHSERRADGSIVIVGGCVCGSVR